MFLLESLTYTYYYAHMGLSLIIILFLYMPLIFALAILLGLLCKNISEKIKGFSGWFSSQWQYQESESAPRYIKPKAQTYEAKRSYGLKEYIAIEFGFVPDKCSFRYNNAWWKKTDFQFAENVSSNYRVLLHHKTIVGVNIYDIPTYSRRHIIER